MVNNSIRMVGLVLMLFFGAILWNPLDASAGLGGSIGFKSIVCDVESWGGGPPDQDRFVTCAAKIKEITGFCKNPAFGSAVESSGQPFTVETFVSAHSTGEWVRTQNKPDEQRLTITNQRIQEALDIYNSQVGNPFVFLKTTAATCKKGWNSLGWFITKADATLSEAKVPSVQDAAHNIIASGHAAYAYETPLNCPTDVVSSASGVPEAIPLTTHCRCVAVPQWPFTWDADGEGGTSNGVWNGSSYVYVKACDFVGDPFRYCSRFPSNVATTANDGGALKPADGGLRIYDINPPVVNNELVPRSVSDKDYKVSDCYLWRDVNKDPAFALDLLGTYDPDVDNILSPQTGNPPKKVKGVLTSVSDDKLGGLVLRSVSSTAGDINLFTGECHQHGNETNGGGNYAWNQKGPDKKNTCIDPDTGNMVLCDPMCRGGSQLLDGVYDDGILP